MIYYYVVCIDLKYLFTLGREIVNVYSKFLSQYNMYKYNIINILKLYKQHTYKIIIKGSFIL